MSLNVGIEFVANTRNAIQSVNDLRSRIIQTTNKISDAIGNKIFATGAITSFGLSVKNALSDIVKIGDFSKKFHLPIDEVNKFSNAFASVGVDTEDTLGMIEEFQKDIAQLRTEGSGKLLQLGKVTGLNIGRIKDYKTLFEELRRVYRFQNEFGKTQIKSIFGFSPRMVKILEMSNKEYSDLLKKSENMSVSIEKSYEALDTIRLISSSIKTGFSEASKAIVGDALPALEKISEILKRIDEFSPKAKKGILYGLLFAGLSPLMLKMLPLLVGGLLNPVTLLAGAGILTYLGWDNLVNQFEESWTQIFETFEWVKKQWEATIKGLTTAWDYFVKQFEDVFSNIMWAIDKIKSFWNDTFNSDKKHYGTVMSAVKSPNQGTIMQQAIERGVSSNNGMMLQGNTFNVSIVGAADPFEMYDAFQIGVTNEINGIGGF